LGRRSSFAAQLRKETQLKGELVRVWTQDGLQLQGLYCEAERSRGLPAVLHIHGASSNFYRSQFLDGLADELCLRGYAFLTGNTRGHDIINSVYSREPTVTRRIGVAFEVFEDCTLDIAAWLGLLQELGHEQMVLLGHSFGAHKVAFYQSETLDERIRGLIIMSPADQGIWLEAMGDQADQMLKSVSDMVASGQGDRLLDRAASPYPMSARTVHSLFVTAKPDIFRFGRPDDAWEVVERLNCPILGMMGTVAEFTSPSSAEALARLKAKAVSSPRCDTIVVQGAPHNYRGYEREVSDAVLGWLEEVVGA
jgi:pimeloyl-ACP methyl ester carboxylesterase